LPACSRSGPAQPADDKLLRVLVFQDNHSRAVAERLGEFERLSGARVVFDAVASNTVAAKTGTDQAAGGSYDLYAVDEPHMPQLSPFLLPVRDWPRPRLVPAAEVDRAQFLPAAVRGGAFRGTEYGLPVNGNVYMYIYRKDLLRDPAEQARFRARYGYELEPPRTTAQMRDVAEFFTRPPGLYGFAPFTKVSEGTTVEAIWILATFGTRLFDDDLVLRLDEARAAAAFRFYREMMRFAPPGASNWHHAERMSAYARGRLAQVMTWPSLVRHLEDPARSLVVGKTGYGVAPAGPAGAPAPVAGIWTLAIPRSSPRKQLAAEFAHWWAARSSGRALVAEGMNPARRDLLTDRALVVANPWFPAILDSFERAISRPRFPAYQQLSDLVSRHFTRMVSGQSTPEEAARELRQDLEALVSRIELSGR
jgi:multiple sugar transport system substrate-binding protein